MAMQKSLLSMPEQASTAAYSFPLLKATAIIECLQDLRIPISQETLENPAKNREEVIRVLEKLVEATSGITREAMSLPAFSPFEVIQYKQLHEESIPELAFYRACSKMMHVSCVRDFCLKDLMAPTKQRLKKHLSAVINFCKFREEQMTNYHRLCSHKDQLLGQMAALQDESVKLERELAALHEHTAEEAARIEEVEADCKTIESNISVLNKQQAEIRQESGELKKTANDLKDRLSTLDLSLKEGHAERERLTGQIVNSPERIRREMTDQLSALEQERADVMHSEREAQRSELCAESLGKGEKEVLRAIKALDEVDAEVSRQRDAQKEVRVTQKTVAENTSKTAVAKAEMANLERQVQRFSEKMMYLRKHAQVKGEGAEASLADLKEDLAREERLRSEAIARLEQAEAEKIQVQQDREAALSRTRAEKEEMIVAFQRLQKVVVRHNAALVAAMRGDHTVEQ